MFSLDYEPESTITNNKTYNIYSIKIPKDINDNIRVNYTINNDSKTSFNCALFNAPFDNEKKYNLLQSVLKKEFKGRSLIIDEKLKD